MSLLRSYFAGAVLVALLVLCGGSGSSALAQDGGGWEGSEPYMRVVDLDDSTMRLDIAVRLFVPLKGDGPTVMLAGAMHIAEPEFFHLLQQLLDSQDLVLFEGVKPRGVGGLPTDDDAVRQRRTESAMRFVAIMLHREYGADGPYPTTLGAFIEALGAKGDQKVELVRSSAIDAWGRPFEFRVDDDRFDLRSLGADGKVGGEGFDRDLVFSDQKPLSAAETGADPGLQAKMARALGLSFQLDELHHDGPTYRNSDMTIDQVQELVAQRGGDASMLFQILDGSSIMGKIASFMLGMIERNEQMQTMMRIMLIETMRAADIENIAKTPGMPKGMAELVHVIVIDRNKVVIEDLKGVLAGDDVPESIGIVYGAGHMGDLEKRLVNECGYRHAGGFWLRAISVDIAKSGLSAAEIGRMRKVMEMMQGGGR